MFSMRPKETGGIAMRTPGGMRIFSDATAIITGGASGIGRAVAEELATRGCEVVLVDLQIESAQKVASDIRASGGRANAVEVDVTNFSALEQIVQETVRRTGRLDYMFNNAGIGIVGDVNHYSIEDWNYILDVNLRGVINGVQATYNIMTAQGFGHIVNTASLAGITSYPGMVSYTTTKYAVVGLSLSLRGEARGRGIRVSVLCPGFIRTAILDNGGKYGKTLVKLSAEQQQIISEMVENFKPMDPNLFAREALNHVAKNKAIIVLPKRYKVIWWINRFFPSLGMLIGRQSYQDSQEKLGIVGTK
jgi:NAD(P)-dependent dehydrogenase (short-subunit alcohol dehydrogenase family)